MSDRELIAALNRLKVETGSLACMGCGPITHWMSLLGPTEVPCNG